MKPLILQPLHKPNQHDRIIRRYDLATHGTTLIAGIVIGLCLAFKFF